MRRDIKGGNGRGETDIWFGFGYVVFVEHSEGADQYRSGAGKKGILFLTLVSGIY